MAQGSQGVDLPRWMVGLLVVLVVGFTNKIKLISRNFKSIFLANSQML